MRLTAKRSYRAGLIRSNPADRQRLNKAETEVLERQIHDVLVKSHPQSVRHAYYAMTNPRLQVYVPKGRVIRPDGTKSKNEPGYDCVQHRCLMMREQGTIPYNWFSDLSRRGYFTPTYDNASDFIEQHVGNYRAHIWQDAEVRCEIWCESRSLAGVIIGDCDELAVDLYPSSGYVSKTFAHAAASDNNAVFHQDKRPLEILYIGDLDPHGKMIDRDLERELRKHLHPDMDVRFRRIAITPEQVMRYDLPDKGVGEHRVEGEAMPAELMRQILHAEVEALLPGHALFVSKVAEASERSWLENMARLRGSAA
jgi:hypothetical protein